MTLIWKLYNRKFKQVVRWWAFFGHSTCEYIPLAAFSGSLWLHVSRPFAYCFCSFFSCCWCSKGWWMNGVGSMRLCKQRDSSIAVWWSSTPIQTGRRVTAVFTLPFFSRSRCFWSQSREKKRERQLLGLLSLSFVVCGSLRAQCLHLKSGIVPISYSYTVIKWEDLSGNRRQQVSHWNIN